MGLQSNQWVLTQQGWMSPLNLPLPVKAFTLNGWKEMTDIQEGKKNSIQITNHLGHQITISGDQRVAVPSAKSFKFTQAKNLTVGDEVVVVPGENGQLDYPDSAAVKRKEEGTMVNGKYTPAMAFLLGYYYANPEVKEGKLILPMKKYIAGLCLEFINTFKKEKFDKIELRKVGEDFQVEISDPYFFEWLEKNGLKFQVGMSVPHFLWQSPTKTVSGFFLGQILGSRQSTKAEYFMFTFSTREMQRLLLREGVLATVRGERLYLETARSRDEFDQFLAKPQIYPQKVTPWTEERFQPFYTSAVTEIENLGSVSVYQPTIKDSEGYVSEGYYLGV